ncbi:haloalkane dehalogenase [bacterium BMS3Abin05]|nr:haloalkane dehalogenase [bacterium BMS3Abin05]GBE28369.1 haloalkane dehalogenase [bacterium BMS3Bbin03]
MQLEMITQEPKTHPRPTPILFVHGAWHSAWCWAEHFLPYFAEHGYVSHALSLRGHGASEGNKHFRWTRLADYVDDVAQVVDQLPEPPILVGHSMGGQVVQKYLETHAAPAAVLLASVPVKGVLFTTLRMARNHPLIFMKVNLTMSLYPLIGTPALTRESFFSADMPDEILNTYFERLQDESYLAFLDMLIFKLPKPKKINTPLLILGAANDAIFHTNEIEATARAYNTQAEIFPGMAHDMMLEAGWQSVADRILEWLKTQTA